MLVIIDNKRMIEWHTYNEVEPLNYAGEVVVIQDPSKTNFGFMVATPDASRVLARIEFSGNNRRRGPVMTDTDYCLELTDYIRRFLANAKLHLVTIEKHILPDKKDGGAYVSMTTLTEIRAAILLMFKNDFCQKVIEINNKVWKRATLPDGYRGIHDKGSKRYFMDVFPESELCGFFEADMTDCACMLLYVVSVYCRDYKAFCNAVENQMYRYNYFILPKSYTQSQQDNGAVLLVYNPVLGFDNNMSYYSNRYSNFCMLVPVDDVPLKELCSHVVGFTQLNVLDNLVCVCGKVG